jgi:hypothetical protein
MDAITTAALAFFKGTECGKRNPDDEADYRRFGGAGNEKSAGERER